MSGLLLPKDHIALQPRFNSATVRPTRELIQAFQQIFDLPSSDDDFEADAHDVFHVMGGLGITIADELRVDVYISTMSGIDAFGIPDDAEAKAIVQYAMESMEDLHRRLVDLTQEPENNLFAVGQSGLDHVNVLSAQADVEPLSRKEVEAHIDIAIDLARNLKNLHGHTMLDIPPAELMNLDFSLIDCVAPTTAIKSQLQSTRNAEIEEAAVSLMYKAATAKGRGADIPAPNTPWHGPGRRSFS